MGWLVLGLKKIMWDLRRVYVLFMENHVALLSENTSCNWSERAQVGLQRVYTGLEVRLKYVRLIEGLCRPYTGLKVYRFTEGLCRA